MHQVYSPIVTKAQVSRGYRIQIARQNGAVAMKSCCRHWHGILAWRNAVLKLEHGAQAAAKDAAKDAGLSESDEEDENEGIRRVEPGQAAAAAASAAASAAMASSLTVCLSRSHMNFRLSSSVPRWACLSSTCPAKKILRMWM